MKHFLEEKSHGAQVRSRVQWFEEGEKPSSYFHNLEKRKGKEKSWDKIVNNCGEIVFGTDEILKVQKDFFKTLYTSQGTDQNLQDRFCDSIDKKLSLNERQMLDKDIDFLELRQALCQMKNNKSPGPDGLIVEFYKIYWDDSKEPLLMVYNNSFELEELSYTQYLAVITLLYKKGLCEVLKNWRPYSLKFFLIDLKMCYPLSFTPIKGAALLADQLDKI